MKKPVFKTMVVALASAATVATSVAQVATNVVNQTDVPAVISGTFTAPTATVVKGSNAATTYMSSAVSIASTIKIPYVATDSSTTTAAGLTTQTYKTAYATYAYGNAEILKLALNTNNVAGWALAYTNPWVQPSYPLENGGYAALKTTNAPVTAVTNWFMVDIARYNGAYTEDSTRTNGVTTKRNFTGSAALDVTLGAGPASPNEGFDGGGVFTGNANWQKNVQTFGTGASAVKVTNEIYTGAGSGSFAGATDEANVTP